MFNTKRNLNKSNIIINNIHGIINNKFCTSSVVNSNIGQKPITIPENVELKLQYNNNSNTGANNNNSIYYGEKICTLSGPKGKLSINLPSFMKVGFPEKQKLYLSIKDKFDKKQKSMWGTIRNLIYNNILGVSEGHVAVLKFVGTGYRAVLSNSGRKIALKLGMATDTKLTVPKGITVNSPYPNRLVIQGVDKHKVTLFAAQIRSHKPPEPYKGKGIFVNGETIKLKVKKVK